MANDGGTKKRSLKRKVPSGDSQREALLLNDQELLLRIRIKRYTQKTKTCWLWTGALQDGYAELKYKGKTIRVHRTVWETAHKRKAGKWCIRHTCDNRACIRPSHLVRGTKKQNSLDAVRRGRTSNQHTKIRKESCAQL